MNRKKILSRIFIILLVLCIGFVGKVSAVSDSNETKSKIQKISLINSPTISFDNNREKLTDVKINVKDYNKIKNVKIYEVTDVAKNEKKEITNQCNKKVVDDNNQTYTISHEKILKGGKKYFLIEATNKYGYYIKMEFTLGKVTNAVTKKTYYGVNRAPTITQMKIENKSFSFRAIEYWGMKSLTFKDMNNNMQEVLKENNVQKGSTDYSIPLSKLKANSDGVYRLKIYAKEAARNGEARKINRTVAFKVVEKEGTVPTPKKANPKIDKSTVILGVNGVKLLNVSGTEDKAITWSSSNDDIIDIVLRSETRARIKAKKAGIAVVTVTCDGKKYRSQIVVMEKAATSGYYYTVVDGYRIYYKKNGNVYKRLNGTTNYSEAAKNSYNKMYAGTNEILNVIGYIKKDSKGNITRKFDFRALISIDPKYENCTLTILAKDEKGKYTIPVKTSLCVVPNKTILNKSKTLKEITLDGNKDLTKLGGMSRNIDISQDSKNNRPERKDDWYRYNNQNQRLAPGTISTQGGFYQSLFYNLNSNNVLNNNCYTEMGTASSNGSIRLYWQDLKWIYENCKPGTTGVMLRTSKAFTPFGKCTKIDANTNKTQENPSYSLNKRYLGILSNNDGYHKGKVDGYYYKLVNGFRIYYKKENGKYRMLDGRTDYSEVAMNNDFYNSNSNSMYKNTNEILKAIGYKENQYDFRIIIGAEKNLQRCTLTVLAKDETGKYTVPVRSSLVIISGKYKSNVTYSPIKLTGNINLEDSKFLQGGSANVTSGNWIEYHNKWFNYKNQGLWYTPGTICCPGGFYHGITHQNNIVGSYEEMGMAVSNGCNRLYWQDLKWIYENCPTPTLGRKVYITESFEPFGKCEKLSPSTNKTQERANYTLERKCDYYSSNSGIRNKAINAGKVKCYIPFSI